MKEVRGLLVMAYGTPYKEEDIERYYTHIRHGRKPSQEHLDDLTERYRAIGGISPLAKMTEGVKLTILPSHCVCHPPLHKDGSIRLPCVKGAVTK